MSTFYAKQKNGPKGRVIPSEVIRTENHFLIGTTWTKNGSTGNKYSITMFNKGFACSCPAWKKCKHITAVEEQLAYEEDVST